MNPNPKTAERPAGLSEAWTKEESKILQALDKSFNGLSTTELCGIYDPSLMTGERGNFGRAAAQLGVILGSMLQRKLILRTFLSAGWKLTSTGRAALTAATKEQSDV